MRVNIEKIKKKEIVDSIIFDFMLKTDKFDDDLLNAVGAEEIEFVRVYGDISPKNIINSIVAINYQIDARFTARCARCDEITAQEINIAGEKYLADKGDENDKDKEDDESFYIIEFNTIELDNFAIEFLELEVPIRYLCDEECKGLCPKCGKNLNEEDCNCPKKEKNPAFKVLDNFFE